MSAATSIAGSSSAVGYATQLAETSALKRSLSSLGMAIQRGELLPASAILTAFFKANPQYTATSTAAAPSTDPLSQSFQALTTAIANNQVDAAQAAWSQVKSNLASDGVTNLNADPTSEVLAQNKASTDGQIISGISGVSPGAETSIAVLLGGGDSSSSQTGLSSSLISDWLTYKQSGDTALITANSGAGNGLDTAA